MRQRAAVATAATVFAAVLIGSSGSAVARVSQDSDPVVVLFIDDLHIDFRLTPRVRSLLVRLLRLVTHDGQHVGIVTTGYSSISLAPTPDRTLVLSDLRRITGGGLRPDGIIDKRGAGERLRRARVALATARDTIAGVAARSTARTLIIYLSNGYGEPALTGELDELAVAASDANKHLHVRLAQPARSYAGTDGARLVAVGRTSRHRTRQSPQTRRRHWGTVDLDTVRYGRRAPADRRQPQSVDTSAEMIPRHEVHTSARPPRGRGDVKLTWERFNRSTRRLRISSRQCGQRAANSRV